MIKKDKSIIVDCRNFTGIIFYAFEYFWYLKEHGMPVELIYINCSEEFHERIKKNFQDKYKKRYLSFKNISFLKDKPLIFTKVLIVLDYSTFELLNRKLLYQKCFYNFTNEHISTTQTFLEFSPLKNIIDFGDKNIGCKTDNHYPLKLNFKMFRPIRDFQQKDLIEDKIKINNQKENSKDLNHKRVFISGFHESFNKVTITKVNYDRANRLIPECKFYGKEIIIKESPFQYDSVDDRYLKPYQDFDINTSSFIDFIKENI